MRISNRKGMTLPELMVAATYATLMMTSLYAFASFFANAKFEYQANVEVTNLARKAIDKMVWGSRLPGEVERRGIAEAASGTINSSTQFTYTDLSAQSHIVRLNSGDIQYQRNGGAWQTLLDPNGNAAYDSTKVSTSLEFTQPANLNSVDVRVVVGKKIMNRWYYGSAETTVFYRNA